MGWLLRLYIFKNFVTDPVVLKTVSKRSVSIEGCIPEKTFVPIFLLQESTIMQLMVKMNHFFIQSNVNLKEEFKNYLVV